MSYLIKNGEVIAETSETLKSGASVSVAYNACSEAIDANRDTNLVNAFSVKVSNAKKWDSVRAQDYATAINGGIEEFLISE